MGSPAESGREFRLVWLPYCLMKLKDGSYLPVNRRYKPLGVTSNVWADYEASAPEQRVRVSQADAVKLAINGAQDPDRIHLYNDGSIPTSSARAWQEYAERLALLAKLRCG